MQQALTEFETDMSKKVESVEKLQIKLDHTSRSIEKLVDAEKHLLGVHGKCKQQREVTPHTSLFLSYIN